jgi:hypothetical protein
MYKALGRPVSRVQPGWEIDRVLATMRCQKSDRERIFVRWKDRDPIYCSWIEREEGERGGEKGGARGGGVARGFDGGATCDNSSVVEEKSINVHDNLSFDSSEVPDCVEMNIDQPLIVNYGESSDEFQLHYESDLLENSKNNNNSSRTVNNNNPSCNVMGDFGDNTESNQMEIVFPQSLIPPNKPPFASADAAVSFSSAISSRVSNGAKESMNVENNNKNNNNGGSALYLPIAIKISTGKNYRKGLSTSTLTGQKKKSSGDRWDITNVVGLAQSGHFIPQSRPYDDVNIPQWHVMTSAEEEHVPDGEGSSEEETDDSAYEQMHEEANVRLKEMVTEMLKTQQEHVRLKKQKTEHVLAKRDRSTLNLDDGADDA